MASFCRRKKGLAPLRFAGALRPAKRTPSRKKLATTLRTMTKKERSTIQENLAKLYLRLNGYLSSGFLIHTDEKKIDGEVDLIAVRFPFHSQNYTEHNSSPYLETPEAVDFIIAEVKSHGQQLKFNQALINQYDIEPWLQILNWIGLIKPENVALVAKQLNKLVQPGENSQLANLKNLEIQTDFGKVSIRPILFSPESININNSDKFIHWTEINDFLWMCLCPDLERAECGTRYDFTAWGNELYEIVKAYKDRQISQLKFKDIKELYAEIEILRN